MRYIKYLLPLLLTAFICTPSFADNKKPLPKGDSHEQSGVSAVASSVADVDRTRKEDAKHRPAAAEAAPKEKNTNKRPQKADAKQRPHAAETDLANVEELTEPQDLQVQADSVEGQCAPNAQADTLEAQVAELTAQVEELKRKLARADTCYLQLAIMGCRLDYDADRVALASRCVNSISSAQLKAKFEDVVMAAENYTKYYEEIMQLLREAQTDEYRTISFAAEDYRSAVQRKLANTAYRKEFHGKKRVVSLLYIDKIYSDAEAIIRKHSQDHPADFSELLSR